MRSQSVSGVQNSQSSNRAPTGAIRNGSSTASSMVGWHCDTSAREGQSDASGAAGKQPG